MKTMKRNADKDRIVAGLLRPEGVAKPRWHERDISSYLMATLAVLVISFTAVLVYKFGWYRGTLESAQFFSSIGFLVALYLTYRWEWPRLIRYFRHTFRRDY